MLLPLHLCLPSSVFPRPSRNPSICGTRPQPRITPLASATSSRRTLHPLLLATKLPSSPAIRMPASSSSAPRPSVNFACSSNRIPSRSCTARPAIHTMQLAVLVDQVEAKLPPFPRSLLLLVLVVILVAHFVFLPTSTVSSR